MKDILDNFAALIKVKTIVTIILTVVFSVLALREVINAEQVMEIFCIVIAFYYGTQHEKNHKEDEDDKQ